MGNGGSTTPVDVPIIDLGASVHPRKPERPSVSDNDDVVVHLVGCLNESSGCTELPESHVAGRGRNAVDPGNDGVLVELPGDCALAGGRHLVGREGDRLPPTDPRWVGRTAGLPVEMTEAVVEDPVASGVDDVVVDSQRARCGVGQLSLASLPARAGPQVGVVVQVDVV